MSDLIEAIKLFGGIAGLGTAAFTLYDRLVKSRPLLSIATAADPYDDTGVAYLRLGNRSDREIVVTEIEAPPEATIHLHDDTESIIERELGSSSSRMIAPGETVYFAIFLDDDFREALPSCPRVLSFRIAWHWAAGFTWLGGLPLTASIRCADLALVLKDAARRQVAPPNAIPSPRTI